MKYTVMQNKDVTFEIGHLTINGEPVPGAPTIMTTTAGRRIFRNKKQAIAFIDAMTKDYGADTVGQLETAL